ncbi:MAG: LytTR family DNA-binding domain-containing protein [Bacteroidales bacterium]|nr:LytTR family DNA-binding domain-containing protein [Bacteroidales bacterium]
MNCIIIDDEPIARRGMKRLVENDSRLDLRGVFSNADEAADFLAGNPIDLVFLDIQMPGTTGIEFARQIPDRTLIIFTTAYSEYAADSYEVDAMDYLVKPIDTARFSKAVTKAADYIALLRNQADEDEPARPASDYIIIKADRRYHRISHDDITYIEGLKDYVIIHLTDRRVVTRMTVKAMEEALPSDKFLRVNKSNIVNVKAVDSFDNNDVLIGDTEIVIGLAYRDNVIGRLLK